MFLVGQLEAHGLYHYRISNMLGDFLSSTMESIKKRYYSLQFMLTKYQILMHVCIKVLNVMQYGGLSAIL
jgi:Sec7-like guanine-nucleotide exchange factor